MDAETLVNSMRRQNDGHRFARSRSGNVVGYLDVSSARFVPYLGRLLTGGWAPCPAVLVNGAPLVAPADWIE